MEHIITFPKLNLEFTIKETAFSIGSFPIQWYGILIGLGLFLALIYAFKSVDKMNVDEDKLIDTVIFGIIGGIIGARAYYIIFFDGEFFTGNTLMENIYNVFNIRNGGLGFYGGLIGALICGGIAARIKKMNILSLFDLASLGFLIGQSVGRWGNFTNQEAFGEATDLPWGIASDTTGGIAVHPCFLYESLLCLLGFALLHIFTRRLRRYDGQTFLLYMVWYGFIRFFIEQLRTDSLMLGSLRVSVVVSALSVIAGVVMLVMFRGRTSLTGCGSSEVVEVNNIEFGSLRKAKELAKSKEKEKAEQSIVIDAENTSDNNSKDSNEEEDNK